MKKKLLIIPSWYPTTENPALGSFFKEQAELMSENFDVCVLLGKANLVGRKKYLKNILNFKNYKKVTEKKINKNLKEVYFEYNDIVFLNLNKRLKKITEYYELAYLQLINKRWIPDIIHAQSVLNAGVISKGLGGKFKIPVLITEHLPVSLISIKEKQKKSFLHVINNSNHISTVSQYSKRMILKNTTVEDLIVHGNLVDDKLFRLKQLKIDNKKFNIGFVGNPFNGKDPFILIDSIEKALDLQKIPLQINFVISKIKGDFSIEQVKQYAKSKNIKDKCVFYDDILRKDMPFFYQNQNIVISTSISETFGLVVAEALMSGIPVISTDNGGVRDIIEPNVNGIIVKIKDSNAIAENILKIYNKEIVFKPVELRESVKKKFGREAFLKKMSTIYENIISEYNK